MRKLVIIFTALCGLSAPATGQRAEPRVVLLDPKHADGQAVVIPSGSALRLASTSGQDEPSKAVFSGRMTLSGTYELQGYGDEAWVTLWPDKKSLGIVPYWHEWWQGPPTEITLENGWDFAKAVLARNQLHKLKADNHSVRGKITVIVDRYETSIECDNANYFARFVAVVKPNVQLAAKPHEEELEEC